jgi:hypothetical protein
LRYRNARRDLVAFYRGCQIGAQAKRRPSMQIDLQLVPILSLITGILILLMPKLLNYAIGIYLIIIGLVGITGMGRL